MDRNLYSKSEYFEVIEQKIDKRKTAIYEIWHIENYPLGEIKWFASWRKFCFFPNKDTVWDMKCLVEILDLLNDINSKYKEDKEK